MGAFIKRLTSKTLLVNESGAIENFSPSSRATARDRPYYTRACQGDSPYSRGDPLRSPWPTIHGLAKPIRRIVGAIPCGRPGPLS